MKTMTASFSDPPLKKKIPWSQCIIAVEIFLIPIVIGAVNGWMAPALSKLMSPNSPILINKYEASWIASILDIGRIIGSILGALSAEFLGSKTSLFAVGVTEIIGLTILIVADSATLILLSRLICGFAIGMFYVSHPMYIGEVSDPRYRGGFNGIGHTGSTLGSILGNLLGNFMEISEFAVIMLALSGLFVGTFFFLPKSPHHLVLKGRINKAAASIKFYRRDVDVHTEIESLGNFLKAKQASTHIGSLKELMTIPQNRQSLLRAMGLFILLQFSGHYAVTYYSQVLLENEKTVDVIHIESSTIVTAITAAGLIGSVIGMLTSDKFGRKVLLGISSFISSLSLISMALYYDLLGGLFDPTSLQWFLVGAMLFRNIFLNYGIYSVLGTIMGEFFAPDVKSMSVCIVNIVSGLSASTSIKMYQPLIDTIGHNVYYFYGFMMMCLCLHTIIFLPETKGKTLQDIQVMLKK